MKKATRTVIRPVRSKFRQWWLSTWMRRVYSRLGLVMHVLRGLPTVANVTFTRVGLSLDASKNEDLLIQNCNAIGCEGYGFELRYDESLDASKNEDLLIQDCNAIGCIGDEFELRYDDDA